MPVIMFTEVEVIAAALAKMRELSEKILKLSDLKQKPLGPGEGVAARHHELARIGQQLAEAFDAFDAFVHGQAPDDRGTKPNETPALDTSQAN